MTERRENIARALTLCAEASKLPWSLIGGTHDREIIDDHGCHVATAGTLPDAAFIVAAVNALPGLADAAIAADGLQGRVLALAEEWDAQVNDTLLSPVQSHIWHLAVTDLRAAVDGADSGSATT